MLEESLGETTSGAWAAREVGLIVSRQNGKGSILEARELAGLFLFGEKLIMHTAHQFKTSSEHFLRMRGLVENTPDLLAKVKPRGIRESHGEEGIELAAKWGGCRLRFVARSINGSGRGFAQVDVLVIDEAFEAQRAALASLRSTQLMAANPQAWFTSSVEDRGEATEFLKRLRDRGRAGTSSRLAYFEWSAPDDATIDDLQARAQANPGLGIRLAHEALQVLADDDDGITFRIENLSIWPQAGATARVISEAKWTACANSVSRLGDEVTFGIDVDIDREWSSITAYGNGSAELIAHGAGTDWVVDRMLDLVERWKPARATGIDPSGPAGSLIDALKAAGIPLAEMTSRDMAQACGAFYDAVMVGPDAFTHLGSQAPLNAALAAAQKRPLADAWAFARKGSTADISPLVALVVAMWASSQPVLEVAAPVSIYFFGDLDEDDNEIEDNSY